MALSAGVNFEVRPATGSDSACSGGFDPTQTAGMLTDGAATSATGTAPVFSSASYNFVSGDIGAYVYIAAGTNWIPGWYKIASVASNQATLSATAAQGTLAGGTLTTVNGCATTASPTGATWTIDYSQQASAQVTFTDLVIGATTTQLTSVLNPFGKQWVGNILQVTSGSGFSTGFYTIASVSSVTATMDRSVGTGASTGGHATMGGVLATVSKAVGAAVAGNWIYFNGTLTVTAAQAITFDSSGAGRVFSIIGYGTYRGDSGRATWTTATNSINIVNVSSLYQARFQNIAFTNTAGTKGTGNVGNAVIALTANAWGLLFSFCTFSGFNTHIAFDWQNIAFTCIGAIFDQCKFGTSVTHGIVNTAYAYLYGCLFTGCGGDGYRIIASTNASAYPGPVTFEGSVFYTCGGKGILNQYNQSPGGEMQTAWVKNCLFHSNVSDGINGPGGGGTAPLNSINNAFWNNGTGGTGYGINNASGEVQNTLPYGNAYGSNATGARNNFPVSIGGDITLTADPCNSASTGDFSLNSTAGGGAALTGTGWQSTIL